MLIINQFDIEKAVNPSDLITAVEKAYVIENEKDTYVPNRMHLNLDEKTLLLMPGFIKSVMGTKLVSVFPGNAILDKPVLHGLMVLNDSETGEPIAIINGSKLTAMRTGAVGATAIKHLAGKNANILGIIGAGVQAFHQAIMALSKQSFKKLIICDFNPKKTSDFKKEIEIRFEEIDVCIEQNPNILVQKSDVIITATTSETPVFETNGFDIQNKTFIGIGSYKPNMQELPLSLFNLLNTVYVDTMHARQESGDIKIPIEKGIIADRNIVPFCSLLTNKAVIKRDSVYLFKSVGMALFDLTVAQTIYKKVQEKGLGIKVDL